jgi:hypothetical protein
MADQDAFQKALAEARAKAAKFREEGKLPPEDPNAKKIKVHLDKTQPIILIILAFRRPERLPTNHRRWGTRISRSWLGKKAGPVRY